MTAVIQQISGVQYEANAIRLYLQTMICPHQ